MIQILTIFALDTGQTIPKGLSPVVSLLFQIEMRGSLLLFWLFSSDLWDQEYGVRTAFEYFTSQILILLGIFCFIIHQVRSDPQPRDGLYHQRQVLLRNDPSAFTTLVNLLRLSWTWKQRAAQPWGRHIPLIALCIVHIAFFAVASLLVGFAATTGTDGLVLLRGEDVCYWWHASGSNLNAVTLTSFWATERPLLQEVHVYAEDCYDVSGLTVTNTKPCNSSFASANIGFSVELNVDCPFPDPSFCRSSKEGAVRMTSELINSNKHLGLNAKLEDQINFRQIMTCSPLPDTIDTPYANDVTQSVFDGTSGNFDITERYFRYSANRNNDSEAMIAMWSNSTAQIPYHFDSELWLSNTTDPSLQPPWTLNEGLAPDMADFTLILITNAVTYTDSSNDTIFGTIDCEPGQSCSSRTFSALGCTQQFQFCNPVNGLCTRQGGWFDIGYLDQTSLGFKLWNDDGLTELQHGTIYNIHIASMYAQLPYLFSGLQSDTLFASRQLLTPDSRLSSPLPNNQTVQEYKYWFSMTLAALQDSFIQLALTPASDDLVPFVKNSSLAELCQRQKVRSSDYTSISVVGLVVIIVVGCAVIALSVVLPNIVAEMQRAFGTEPYLRREWRANAIFHLQREIYPSSSSVERHDS